MLRLLLSYAFNYLEAMMSNTKEVSSLIKVEVSPGELIDKITILEIKNDHIKDKEKLKNVNYELNVLLTCLNENIPKSDKLDTLRKELKTINLELWVIEDDIRDCELKNDFGPKFIELARAVYVTNDKRAHVKKEINLFLGSNIIEEKSYKKYKA